jgi:nitroimidazol reductase NimA-like FMN-containing flavoprotein (pyridoxamine 5'-phosphate oxidase superfamily)
LARVNGVRVGHAVVMKTEDITEPRGYECWALLRTAQVGRLALICAGHPEILPVNYLVDQGSLVVRTGEGSLFGNLTASGTGIEVALEVDGVQPEGGPAIGDLRAWSVVVRGYARRITGPEAILNAAHLPVFPWLAGLTPVLVRIEPTDVSGRQFADSKSPH